MFVERNSSNQIISLFTNSQYDGQEYLAGAVIYVDHISIVGNKIKTERDRRKDGGVFCKNKWFHSDSISRIQLFGLKDRARDMVANGGLLSDIITILGNNVSWKTMDGTFVTITGQLAFDIVEEVGNIDAQLHATGEWHKAQMIASPNPASYDYSGGWPMLWAI